MIDFNVLVESMGDEDIAKMLLSMYMEEHADDPVVIKSAYDARDLDSLFHVIHSLKGSLANFQAEEVAAKLDVIEVQCRSQQVPAPQNMNEILKDVEAVNDQIRSLI